jgi:hypothetical protein
MFIVNIVVGEVILDRKVFWSLSEAYNYVQHEITHKVWRLSSNKVYYGKVEAKIYEPKLNTTADYTDEHILSFTHSI